MKTALALLTIFVSMCGFSQKFKTANSEVHFFSSAPLEDIEARSTQATSLIDVTEKTIAIVIPMRSFEFEKSLMKEHFNENYIESDKYPNASFKGVIENWDDQLDQDSAVAVGELTMHGVTRDVELTGLITQEKDRIKVDAQFSIVLADYKIKIPKIVWQNIAEEVEVTTVLEYQPYE